MAMGESFGGKGHDGLTTDLEHLMLRFVRTESVRYEQFSSIWREMNFTMIYSGLKKMELKKEFIQVAFHQAMMYVSPPFDFQRRIGGLYLLYGLYYTQTHRPRLKIRISGDQWEQLINLFEEIKSQGHLDAMYIFIKLRAEKAFTFVVNCRQLVYTRIRRDESQEKWLAENQRDIEETFPNDLLTQLHKSHLQYQEMKSALEVDDKQSMQLVDKSIAEYIINRLRNIQEDLHEEMEDREEATKRMSYQKAVRMAEIKSKSFGRPGVSKSRRHVTTEVVSSATNSEEPVVSPIRRGPGRRPKEKVIVKKPSADSVFPKKLKQFELSESEDEETNNANTEPIDMSPTKEDSTPKQKSPKAKKDRRKGKKDSKKAKKSPKRKVKDKIKQHWMTGTDSEATDSRKKKSSKKGKGTKEENTKSRNEQTFPSFEMSNSKGNLKSNSTTQETVAGVETNSLSGDLTSSVIQKRSPSKVKYSAQSKNEEADDVIPPKKSKLEPRSPSKREFKRNSASRQESPAKFSPLRSSDRKK